jgi:ribosome-binding protein aMBF1 (putative translation factor)
MTSNKIEKLKERFTELDNFENKRDKIEHEKMIAMFYFLSDVQKIIDKKGWSRQRLATEIGVSPSYLSQLYSGDKVINLEMITKIAVALDCNFEIKLNSPVLSNDQAAHLAHV